MFAIMKLWLNDCMHGPNHKDCQVQARTKPPTRLVEVGTESEPLLRLVEIDRFHDFNDRYVALSFPWGNASFFCTYRVDPSGMGHDYEAFKQRIPEDKLPQTLKDAVICTRRLGMRYIFIDSICILQGPDGDFIDEAKKLEDIFGGAALVIAATRTQHQHSGLFSSRPRRPYVTFRRGDEKPFYVCEAIDDFSKDVIKSAFNARGWVLQERALARRIIHFAERQTYFECGNGVRCETLAKMHQ